jgi:hypothetical protein
MFFAHVVSGNSIGYLQFAGIQVGRNRHLCWLTNMLSDANIRSLQSAAKPFKKADGGGLFILVQPNGKKLWRHTYRYGGKQKLLSGGEHPVIKLAEARKWRDEARAHLFAGRDPSQVRKTEIKARAAESANAFEIVAREWLHTRSRVWSERYARITTTRLEQDIFPDLGKVPIADIDPVMLLEAFRKIEARGSIEMAHRIRNHVGEVFRYGIATQRCRSDPSRDLAAAMMRPPPVKHHAKVSARDLPEFYAKLAQDEGTAITQLRCAGRSSRWCGRRRRVSPCGARLKGWIAISRFGGSTPNA